MGDMPAVGVLLSHQRDSIGVANPAGFDLVAIQQPAIAIGTGPSDLTSGLRCSHPIGKVNSCTAEYVLCGERPTRRYA
jgi:hypothetical protein